MRYSFATALLLAASAVSTGLNAETIVLKNGDVINAEKVGETQDALKVKHPALGEIEIKKDQIDAVYDDADAMKAAQVEASAKEKAEALEAERAADEGVFGFGFLKGWNRTVKLGVSGAEGNSQNLNFRASFHADYEDDADRWIYDMVYRAAKSNSATTENQFFAALTKDWLVPEEDYFYFATGRYDWDQFQDWDSRVSGFGGIGYQFLKDDKWDLRGRAGAGGNQTFGGTTNSDEFTPEALAGIDLGYKIKDGHTIAFSNYVYPSLEELGDFRNVTTLDYVIGLKDNMNLTLGMANDYDSIAPSTAKKNDFTYYITLGWSF